MNKQARLARAMAAARPPAQDNAFVMAAIEAADRARYRRAAAAAMLRTGGLAAAATALAPTVWAWASSGAAGLQDGALLAGGVFAAVVVMRRLTARVAA